MQNARAPLTVYPHVNTRRPILAAVMVLLVACSQEPRQRNHDGIRLMRLPASHLQECGTFPVLAPVCPERIPFVEAELRRARAFRSGKDHFVFYSEWSGPYPGMSPRNSPPRFAHLVIHGGHLSHALPFDWPTRATALPNPIPTSRRRPVLLENVTWFGIQGQLVLAPSFPTGGIDGDHVIFRWSEENLDYAITLHAWTPLPETIAALRQVVGTIPP